MPVGAQKVQYCRCKINLAGQNCHTVYFTEHNPVTWPEVQVLMFLHGEENVMDIMPVGIGETWPTTEKNRLASIYGSRPVETCFPGRSFRMEYLMTADTDLPFYVDGVPGDIPPGPIPPREPPPAPVPEVPPEPSRPPPLVKPTDPPEDADDVPSAAAAFPSAEFKPGRNRPGSRPGA